MKMYEGIEFYAKSNNVIVLNFSLQNENRDNREKMSVWFAQKQINTTWQKYRIAFSDLAFSQDSADKQMGGDGSLNLDLIQSFRFAVTPWFNPPESSGTFWVDEIKLY